MTTDQSNIALLSLFYWGLSVVMLHIVIKEKRSVLYLLSIGYFFLSAIVGWKVEMKWLLMGSLIFMVAVMFITLWIIFKQSGECIRDLKKLREEEQRSEP